MASQFQLQRREVYPFRSKLHSPTDINFSLHHFYYRVTVKFAQPRKLVGAVKLLLTNLTVKQRLYHSDFGSNVGAAASCRDA